MKIVSRITVCGGGNAAHVAIPLLVNRGFRVTLYTPFADEAVRFREGAERGGLEASFFNGQLLRGSPHLVTANPAEAAAADLILIVVPAFAHGPLLQALSPYLQAGTAVGAIPSRSGFELQALSTLPEQGKKQVIFCGQTLPWACRIESYGQKVRVLGTKVSVGLAAIPPENAPGLADFLSEALGVNFTPLPNSLTVSLGNIGQVIHPGIMYGLLKNYSGEIWSEADIPLFYQGVTEETAQILETLSAEIVTTSSMLAREFAVDLEQVLTVGQWLVRSYARYIRDSATLARSFQTNQSYQGLKLPVKKVTGGYIPDFESRYLTEDIPFGLLFSRAVAEMIDSPTPRINEVITACSGWINKRYLDQRGKLAGPDLKEARIPQHYGINDALRLITVSLGGYG